MPSSSLHHVPSSVLQWAILGSRAFSDSMYSCCGYVVFERSLEYHGNLTRASRSNIGTDLATSIRARRLLSSIMARRDTLELGLEQLDRCVSEMTRQRVEEKETEKKGETRPCIVNACKLEPFSRESINKQLNDDNASLSLVLRDVVVDLCGLCVLSVSEKQWCELKTQSSNFLSKTNDSVSNRSQNHFLNLQP